MKYGIIIPCFNEEKRLQIQRFKKFAEKHRDYHFCFVNDGSKDNTLKVLKQLKKYSSYNIDILNLSLNKGKSFAVLEGIKHLFLNYNLANIGFLDADLSTSLEEYHQMNQKLISTPKCQFISGIRGRNTSITKSRFRKFVSGTAKQVITSIFTIPLEDTQCGAKIFKSSAIPYIFNKPFKSKWLFDIELFIRCMDNMSNSSIGNEIDVYELKNWKAVGESRLRKRDFVLAIRDISTIYITYRLNRINLQNEINRLQFEPIE